MAINPTQPQASMLQNLAGQMPVANQQIAAQQKAARDLQLLQAVQKAPVGGAIIPTAQQTGAAMAAQAGQEQVQRIQNAAQSQAQIAQMGQQLQGLELQKQQAQAQMGLKEQAMSDAERLGQISEAAKQEMFDSRLKFQKDEMGRQFLNERQLADYAALRARTNEDWQNYVQRSEQMSKRKELVLQAAQQKLLQQIQFENQEINQIRDQLSRKGITEREAAAKRDILQQKMQLDLQLKTQLAQLEAAQKRAQSRAASTKARNTAIGTVVGSVAGAVVGGILGTAAAPGAGTAVGAAAGASAGGQLGGGLGAMV